MKNHEKSAGFWEKMRKILGENDFQKFEKFQKKPLRKTIRVNLLKNSVDEFLAWAAKNHSDWILTPHAFSPEVFFIDRKNRKTPLGATLGHASGRFYLQEASSTIPPKALFLEKNLKILDAAAAPGSKTTQIAAEISNSGLLVANEFSASRAKILVFNLQKCGVKNAIITNFSAEKFGEKMPNFFDRILLDAPCTGEGTFRKDKSALEKWSEKKILSAAKLQKNLIENAFLSLAENGILVYSTCTLAPEENEFVVDFLQKKFPENAEILDLKNLFPGAEKAAGLLKYENREIKNGEKMLRIWPHYFDSEGFFVAAIRKKFPTKSEKKPRFVFHGKKVNLKTKILFWKDPIAQKILHFLKKEFCFEIPKIGVLTRKNADIFWTPPHSEKLFQTLKIDRPGLKLGKIAGDDFRISSEAAIALGKNFSGNRVVNVSKIDAEKFLRGENLPSADEIPRGDVVIFCENLPIGIAKNLGKILKNNLPRNFLK